MQHIENTNLEVSEICMGTATLGSDISTEKSFELLDIFYECGGNIIDTSNIYADWIKDAPRSASEKTIGAWLKQRNLSDKIIISTKGGHKPFVDGKTGDNFRLKRDELNDQIQRSIENLNKSSIDLYYLHRDDVSLPVEDIMDTLFLNCEKGYIRYIGCSNWATERLKSANEYAKKCNRQGFVVSSDRWSYARFKKDPDPEIVAMDEGKFCYIKENGMTSIPFQGMGRGTIPLIAQNQKPSDNYDLPINYELAKRAMKIAKDRGTDAAAVSIAYLTNQPFTVIPIMSFETKEQLESAFFGAKMKLSKDEMKYLSAF